MYYSELVTAVNDYVENNFPTVDLNRMIQQAEQRIYNTVQIQELRKNVTGSVTPSNPYLAAPTDFLSTYSLAIYPVTGTSGDYTYLINKDVNYMREAYPNPNSSGQPKYYAIFGPNSTNPTDLVFILGPTPNTAYTAELHYFYYPDSIIQSALSSVSITNAGSGYTNGTYYNVPLAGGTGNSATATIVVSGNVVTSVTLVGKGCYFAVGDVLSASIPNGTNFALTVTAITNVNGETWLSDNFDTALLNAVLYEAITYVKGDADMVALYKDRYIQAVALLKNLGDGKQRGDAYRDGQVRTKVE